MRGEQLRIGTGESPISTVASTGPGKPKGLKAPRGGAITNPGGRAVWPMHVAADRGNCLVEPSGGDWQGAHVSTGTEA